MQKVLSRVGNSKALILDRTLLELIGVDEDGEVEIQVHGDALIVRAAPSLAAAKRLQRLQVLGSGLMDRFDEAYRKLGQPER